jgi:hypothetical protein
MLIRRLEAVVPQVLFRVLAQTGVPFGGARSSRMWCHVAGSWTPQPMTIKTIHSFETSGKDKPSNTASTFQHTRFLILNSVFVEASNTALTITSTHLRSARTCGRRLAYGPDDWGFRVRMLAGFPSLNSVEIGSEAQPAFLSSTYLGWPGRKTDQ